jgi:hypothetical protein
MTFDNGASMPHSPALYRPQPIPQSYHPPPTPVTQQAHYDGPHGYAQPPPMYPATLEIQAASAKRKAQRASQVRIRPGPPLFRMFTVITNAKCRPVTTVGN